MLPRLYKKVRGLGGQVHNDETFGYVKIEGDRDKIIDTMYNIVMPDVNRKLANALPRKFDELMNSTKKYNRYINILNKSYEAYKTKDKYVYFIIISKSNEVYLTTYEQKPYEENLHVYDDEIINYLDYDKIDDFNKNYLGKYASTNIDEFMAEGFTEYKLSSNPSKYAVEIGKLIDKYFKK
jgi:hypothetical protein